MTSPGAASPEPDVVTVLAGFARAVRASGVPVTHDRTTAFLTAAAEVGADDRAGVYWAGRATLCSDVDHLAVYDAAFEEWFGGRVVRQVPRRPPQQVRVVAELDPSSEGPDADADRDDETDDDPLRAAASAEEVLRHRDVADLEPAAREQVLRLLAGLDVRLPSRRSSRRRPAARGELDVRRTLREELRRGGEPGPLRYRRPTRRPRRVVWLVDVSGSMSPYADVLLRLAHRHARTAAGKGGARVEVFTLGTRLTRVTPAMAHRDVEQALRAAGDVVPDWSGGTRLGETLRAFVDRWGQRGVARGAVVVVCSDGWERGDPVLLGEQVQRLSRIAHRVVWLNPHRGKEGYLPVQGGIAAALPYVDDLVAGHSVAAYHRVMEVVAGA